MRLRKLLIDESVPQCIRERLRDDGNTLILAQDLGKGLSDEELLTYAAQEKAVFLTRDRGLGHRVVWGRLPAATVAWLDVDGILRDKQPGFVAERLAMGVPGPGMYHLRGGYYPRLSPEFIRTHGHRWVSIDAANADLRTDI